MLQTISRTNRLQGQVKLPPDKSIAHRAALFASIAEGTSTLYNFPTSADPQSTLSCLRQLGVVIKVTPENTVIIEGVGRYGFCEPDAPLDCGNSGTTMRLLAGMLAGQPFDSELIGDTSLSIRPMGRIAEPLRAMGAHVHLTDGHVPIQIRHSSGLSPIDYRLPVASAQVKSCVLLAGLWASGNTIVREITPSRDHTERMLHLSTSHSQDGTRIRSTSSHLIPCTTLALPGDFSAAAFLLVAASIAGTGPIFLPEVGLNPSRTGLLNVLQQMGANIQVTVSSSSGTEPIGDLTVRPASLHGITIQGSQIPNLIDEIPVIAVAGAYATGTTIIRDATELRHKECDRIHAIVTNLRRFGAQIEEFEDGFAITGLVPLRGATVSSYHDHRIAMAMAIAGLGADGSTAIPDAEVVSVSFPEFWNTIAELQD